MAALDPGPLDLRCYSLDSTSSGVVSMLYNGVSNRSRGWKSKGSSGALGGDTGSSGRLGVKRWDGAARMSSGWDKLRKDPELWYKTGSCFVHLYKIGQSPREPAFKVPFECLLSAKCEPLVQRFMSRSISEDDAHKHEPGQVDLYIPAPPTATLSQALQYHIATRNFFAWVCRRSMVGEYLGNALITLVNSMHEFRDGDTDDYQDLLGYLDEEGYLDMDNNPNHALAILHMAEVCHFRGLYIDAFAHCVGMSERLYKFAEYSRISITSRKLIRRARVDMDHRLSHAGAMLNDLLQEELSEAHLGLSTSARAHLDHFRVYIHKFYLTKLGSFPPPPADPRCSTIFKPEIYRGMRADFEALYEYLVDERYTTEDNSSPGAQGGLCTLQSVQSFDLRHSFMPLPHPLPLLPAPFKGKESRGRKPMPWTVGINRTEGEGKLRPDQRLIAHAAMMRATNSTKVHLLENGLILAYRRFEENFIVAPQKDDRAARLGLSQGDARKVRWLFVYAMYQALRNCTEIPPEVKWQKVDYHLAVSTEGVVPWQDQVLDNIPRSPSFVSDCAGAIDKPTLGSMERCNSSSTVILDTSYVSPPEPASQLGSSGIEIKPDIDYFALTHPDEGPSAARGRSTFNEPVLLLPQPRSRSLTKNVSLRRSMSKFRNAGNQQSFTVKEKERTTPHQKEPGSSRKSIYHEIVINGYGNGVNSTTTNLDKSTESVDVLPALKETSKSPPYLEVTTSLSASRSSSTSSSSSYGSMVSSLSDGGNSCSTTPTTADGSPRTPHDCGFKWDSMDIIEGLDDIAGSSEIPVTISHQRYDNLTVPSRDRTTRKSIRKMFSSDDVSAAASNAEAPPLPRRNSRRFGNNKTSTTKRWSLIDVVVPLRERDDDSDSDSDVVEPPRRRTWKAGGSRRKSSSRIDTDGHHDDTLADSSDHEWEMTVHSAVEVSPPWSWEQFTDLGGLQPASPTK